MSGQSVQQIYFSGVSTTKVMGLMGSFFQSECCLKKYSARRRCNEHEDAERLSLQVIY